MKIFTSYKELLRRSPVVRLVSIVLFIGIITAGTSLIGKSTKRKPTITGINPQIGAPGDIMTITGKDFGTAKYSSYVEIAGSKVTAGGYISWKDNEIKLKLPSNVQDGLVIVGTNSGRSDPEFFANEYGIPVAVRADPQTTFPVITSISPQTASVGDTVIISGSNFGTNRGNSIVYFTANRDSNINLDQSLSGIQGMESTYISASSFDYDYELWSDTEIHVRVPDGADSGSVYVSTNKGDSTSQKINIKFSTGKKKYYNHRTYVVQVTSDILNELGGQDSTLSLYIPRPAVSSFQPSADLNDCNPEPLIADDANDIIHQLQLNEIINNKQRFSQTFVVSTYAVNGNAISRGIMPYKKIDSMLYKMYTSPDSSIQSENQAIKNLVETIVGRERYPLEKAKLIYNYLLKNFTILPLPRKSTSEPIDLLKDKSGDAYDFAIIYTTLCRAAEIPAIPVSGILVENNSQSQVHWWTELYFEDYGWFPVDCALGAGLEFEAFTTIEDKANFYFGNIDNQHIAFSRGWKQIKPSLFNSKTVYRPRTYALQSIWEEAGDSTSSYSSLWNDPVVIGIY